MHISLLLHLLPLASSVLAVRLGNNTANTEVNPARTRQFIVEVHSGVDVDALSAKLASQHGAKIIKTYKSDIFSGLSIETDTDNIDTLQAEIEVAQAWPAAQIWLDSVISSDLSDSSFAATNYSVHNWTGVDKAHDAGIYGKGAKVAIVDTGIDYRHPALGGGFGPGFKVAGGYDLVGDGAWPNLGSSKVPDSDPMDYYGHGTHVAGIIAGKNEWFTGVAPEAELYIYKVFTREGGTDEPTLIDAFLMAYEAGADIITSSVGGVSGFSDGPWATVASRIAEKGVIVTISAGNNGQDGPFYASSGSSGKNVLAIASAEAGTLPAIPFELTFSLNNSSSTTEAGYMDFWDPWTLKDWPVYALSLDTEDPAQACQDIAAEDIPDLSNYITLVRHSGQREKPVAPWSWLADNPKILVDAAVGEAIIATIKAGGNVTADFTKFTDPDYYVGMYNAVGNRPNYFTSWGGLFNLDAKPDVAAPGGEILSTYLDDGWKILSGTSMSCPYVAGVAALYIGRYGGRDVHGPGFGKMLANRIVSSGAAMPWSTVDSTTVTDTGFWAPTIQVGSGLINAWKVLNHTTTLSFDKFNLNDTHHFSRYHSVNITNNADVPVEYTFNLQSHAGIEANGSSALGVAVLSDLKPKKMVPSVKFPAGSYVLPPGQTKTAEFIFDYPRDVVEDNQPFFSGKVIISSTIGEQLSIPYFGAAFNLKAHYDSIFESGSVYAKSPVYDLDQKSNFTFDTSVTGATSQDYPKVFASFKWGCSELRWDIFQPTYTERDWKYPPTVGENGYVGSVAMWRLSDSYTYFNPARDDKEDTTAFPLVTVFRNSPVGQMSHAFYWLGKLANGSYITPGNYSMRFAALRPFGTPEHSDNWDIWKTPEITVLPLPS